MEPTQIGGRILAAVGYSESTSIRTIRRSPSGTAGLATNYEIVLDEEKAKELLLKDTVMIVVNLNQGNQFARFWTCDLTKEYVHINASYRS